MCACVFFFLAVSQMQRRGRPRDSLWTASSITRLCCSAKRTTCCTSEPGRRCSPSASRTSAKPSCRRTWVNEMPNGEKIAMKKWAGGKIMQRVVVFSFPSWRRPIMLFPFFLESLKVQSLQQQNLPQKTMLLKRLVSRPGFYSLTSHYITKSHICMI